MRIVNMNDQPEAPYIYCGRGMGGDVPREASPLGNPFKLKGRSKAEIARCIASYREWLSGKILERDPRIMALMRAITEDTALCCWCCSMEGDEIFTAEERCHAQVVFKAWRHLKTIGVI